MPWQLLPRRASAHSLYWAAALTAAGLAGCSRSAPPTSSAAEPSKAEIEVQRHIAAAQKLSDEAQYPAAVTEYTAALEAMRHQGAAVQTNTVDAEVLFQRGLAYLQMGFPDTAAADFTEVLRVRSDDGRAYAKRGEAYVKLGDLYKAVRDCTDAIRYEPASAGAYHYRGVAYVARGQADRAVADLEKAIVLDATLDGEIRPILAVAYRTWSQQLAAADDDVAAAEKLAQAQELDPTLAVADTEAGDDARDGGIRLTAAKEVIDEAREFYEQGVALWVEGKRDDALVALTAAIDARPTFAQAYLERGRVLMATGFPDTAVKDFEQATNFGAGSVEAHRLEAQAFLELGSPHRTVLSATDALHADPVDAASYALRGKAYVALGRWDRALADLTEAVRLNPAMAADLQPALEEASRQRDASQARETASPTPPAKQT